MVRDASWKVVLRQHSGVLIRNTDGNRNTSGHYKDFEVVDEVGKDIHI